MILFLTEESACGAKTRERNRAQEGVVRPDYSSGQPCRDPRRQKGTKRWDRRDKKKKRKPMPGKEGRKGGQSFFVLYDVFALREFCEIWLSKSAGFKLPSFCFAAEGEDVGDVSCYYLQTMLFQHGEQQLVGKGGSMVHAGQPRGLMQEK